MRHSRLIATASFTATRYGTKARCRHALVFLFACALPATVLANDGLVLTGVSEAQRKNILAFTGLDERPCAAPAWQLRRRLAQLPEQVHDALLALGHYQSTMTSELSQADDCWRISVQITPGPVVRYRNVAVSVVGAGSGDPQLQSVVAAAPVTGDALHHGRFDAYKRQLARRLLSRGYVDWEYHSNRAEVTVAEQAIDVELTIDSGQRYRIGEVVVSQDVLDRSLIDRLVRIEPGMPFDQRDLTQLQQDLSSSAYFSRVLVTADFDAAADGRIPVRIELTPSERLGYFVGVGASTDRGPRLRSGYRNRRVNGRGHQFDADLQVSPVLSAFNANYKRPLENPLVEWESYVVEFDDERTDSFDQRSASLGIERTRVLPKGWLLTWGGQISRSKFEVAEDEALSTLLMPVIGLSWRESDSDTNPRRGRSIELQTRMASSDVISTTDFVQVYGRYRQLVPIGQRGRLSFRAELGATALSEISELPPDVRFFAGGDNSVRGYGFQSLGPTDSNDDVIGGENVITASIEYEHALNERWGVAVFADSGNAFDDVSVNPRTGVGFGVVWRSPVGPLRAYLAHPLDIDRAVRLHVTFGADL